MHLTDLSLQGKGNDGVGASPPLCLLRLSDTNCQGQIRFGVLNSTPRSHVYRIIKWLLVQNWRSLPSTRRSTSLLLGEFGSSITGSKVVVTCFLTPLPQGFR